MNSEHQSPFPLIPETCLICGGPWIGGCERPGHRFPKAGLRVFYGCGSSLSIIDRGKELADHEDHMDDGYCYFLRLKNCNSEGGVYAEVKGETL